MKGEFRKFLGPARGGVLRSIKISTRLILFSALLVLLMLSGIFMFIKQFSNDIEQRELDDHSRMAHLLADSVDTRLKEHLAWLVHLGDTEGLDPAQETPFQRMLFEDIYRIGLFPGGIYLVDREGRIRQSVYPRSELVEKIESFSALGEVLATGQPQIRLLTCDAGAGNRWVTFMAPVKTREGNIVGAILGLGDMQYDESAIQHIWGLTPGGGGYTDVLDTTGLVIMSSQIGKSCTDSDHKNSLLPYLESKDYIVGYFPVETPGAEEEMDVVALVPMEMGNWSIATELPKAELRGPINTMIPWILLAGVLGIAGVVTVIWLIYSTVVFPLDDLLTAEGRLSQGDLETPLVWAGKDEIARLASGFESMRVKLANWGRNLETIIAKRTQYLEVINKIQHAISSSLVIEEVYNALATEAAKLVPFDRMRIALLNQDGTAWEVAAQWTDNNHVLRKGMHFQLGGSLNEHVLMQGKPWREGEIGEKGDWPENSLLISEGIHSRLLIPLKYKGNNLGVLTFGSFQTQAFSDADVTLLLPIAEQLAIAIENRNLFHTVQKRLAEQETLTNVSSSMRKVEDMDQMLAVVFDAITGILDTETGEILLFDNNQDHLVVSFTRGQMSGMYGMRIPLDGSLYQECTKTKKLKVDATLPKSSGLAVPLSGQEKSIQIPLLASSAITVGIIHLYCPLEKEINGREIHLLTAIADMAANAIYRMQLTAQLQNHLQELGSLYKISRLVSSTLRVNALMNLVVIAAQESMLVEGSWIHLWDEKQGCLILRSVTGFPV
ncbi:MAG: GAF domain-containing protein [Anaerolineales bacterium]|nr:GAF domain-containing protein [Anaerolineales bacterium]